MQNKKIYTLALKKCIKERSANESYDAATYFEFFRGRMPINKIIFSNTYRISEYDSDLSVIINSFKKFIKQFNLQICTWTLCIETIYGNNSIYVNIIIFIIIYTTDNVPTSKIPEIEKYDFSERYLWNKTVINISWFFSSVVIFASDRKIIQDSHSYYYAWANS